MPLELPKTAITFLPFFPATSPSCPVLSYYTTDKICFPITVITKYWQHSPFVTYILELSLHLSLCLTLHHLCSFPSPPPIRQEIVNVLQICETLFSLESPFCRVLRFCKWYCTLFVFLILFSIICFMLLQMVLISFFIWLRNIPLRWLSGKESASQGRYEGSSPR